MHENFLGDNPELALRAVKALYNPSSPLRLVHEGYENLVIIVDETYVVRFPRTKEIWEYGQAERYVLEKLSSVPHLPIPKIITISEEPAYLVTTYLHGNHLTTKQIRHLPEQLLQKIGKEVAEFAYTLHTSVSPKDIEPLLAPPTWSYDDYLRRVLFDRQDPNPKIDALAKKYYQAWLHTKHDKQFVVHDDLHTGNLLFDSGYNLTGVLDFGAVCLGTAEQDLRQTYRLGDEALEAAASTYEKLSGRTVDREPAKLWTITQELGAYCREDSGVAHDRAAENLQFWFPELSIKADTHH